MQTSKLLQEKLARAEQHFQLAPRSSVLPFGFRPPCAEMRFAIGDAAAAGEKSEAAADAEAIRKQLAADKRARERRAKLGGRGAASIMARARLAAAAAAATAADGGDGADTPEAEMGLPDAGMDTSAADVAQDVGGQSGWGSYTGRTVSPPKPRVQAAKPSTSVDHPAAIGLHAAPAVSANIAQRQIAHAAHGGAGVVQRQLAHMTPDVTTINGSAPVQGSILAHALDIDPDAIEVARDNLMLNQMSELIECGTAPLEALTEKFDIILANILAEELVRLAPYLTACLLPGGALILSGILAEKENLVKIGFSSQPLHYVRTVTAGEWVALLYQYKDQV